MRAAVLYYPRELRIEERPDPSPPGPHEVILDVKMSGICGTDLHLYEGRFLRPGTPFPARVLGHDFAAVVREVGSAVTDLAPGDRVTLDPTRNCGQCGACRAGAPNLCVKWAYMGMGIDGCLQDALVAERKYVHRLPDTVSDEEASVIEPVVVGLHVFDKRLTDRRGNETVVVIGCGPIGVAALQIAKLRGHERVIMVDIVPERLEFAARFGATELINPREGDAAKR
ncbi:MAG: alcohol dehydrogenase catalytic domain-containing protein, partial [Dehalococcoidia bacterium]|nr:alcohol dehydrogenase catalytic domain-containing protein [Dehalococcoidia bacterium]